MSRRSPFCPAVLALGMMVASMESLAQPGCTGRGGSEGFALAPGAEEAALPRRAMVYRVVHPEIDEEEVRSIAKRHFGMEGPVKRNSQWYRLSDGARNVEVDATTGSIVYRRLDIYAREFEPDALLPGAEEAVQTAKRFLRRHSLLPEDAIFSRAAENPGQLSVAWKRVTEGIEHWGAGARLHVAITPGMEVKSVLFAWRELEPDGRRPLIGLDEAIQRLNRGEFLNSQCPPRGGLLSEPRLVYYSSPERQSYISPHLLFELEGGCGERVVVPALRRTLE